MATATKAKSKTPAKTVEATPTQSTEATTPPKPIGVKIPAVRGTQSGREYYIAMVRADQLVTLFPKLALFPSQADIDIRDRYQRELSPSRAKEIAKYVISGSKSEWPYALSAASASLKAEAIEFSGSGHIGTLKFSGDWVLKLLDGQHRVRGLILAADRDEEIHQETLSIVILRHVSDRVDQQWFSDMNGKARPATKSLAMTFDHRDEAIAKTREVLERCLSMRRLIDFDRDSCPRKSGLVFGFREFHQATQVLRLHGHRAPGDIDFAAEFWAGVIESSPIYKKITINGCHAQTAREVSIAPTTSMLMAIGYQGASVRGDDLQPLFAKLKGFDCSITNPAIVEATGGKVLKNAATIAKLQSLIFG